MNNETLIQQLRLLQRENTELREELREMLIIVFNEFPMTDDLDHCGRVVEIADKYGIDITS